MRECAPVLRASKNVGLFRIGVYHRGGSRMEDISEVAAEAREHIRKRHSDQRDFISFDAARYVDADSVE